MPATPWQLVTPERVFEVEGPASFVVIGRRARLLAPDVVDRVPAALRPAWPALVARLAPGHEAATAVVSLGADHAIRVHVAVLPDGAARHEAPARADQVTAVLGALDHAGATRVLVACDRGDDAIAHAIAVTRALPTYSRKTAARATRDVGAAFLAPDRAPAPSALERVRDAVADAMVWQDTPCAELGVDAFVDLAVHRARAVDAEVTVLRGDELLAAGLRGIHAVGRAAAEAPALVVLRRPPRAADARRIAWVGKGVVFDTGGLSLKRPGEMLTMKGDMGGAAAALAAFAAAASHEATAGLDAVLCIAENAIGPDALRPDDIITLHSGKTVEVVDTDCEGRLLVADGLSYATSQLGADVLVDLATLTDSAVVATGHRHAAIVCNDDELERAAVAAGRDTGDLVHPLLYAPAYTLPGLASEVADLRNAAPTSAAGASCTAQFIAAHLEAHRGPWLHIDMEGPARNAAGRGTGFGVGLLLRCFGYV